MRKICVLFLFALLLFSCGQKFDLLKYQNGDISARCLVNDEYVINVKKSDGLRSLSIIEPSELDTISFELENGECVAICDGAKIPLDISKLDGIVAMCSIFDLDEGAISSTLVEENGTVVSFSQNDLLYSVSYGKDSLPTKIDISGDGFVLSLKILEITK